MKLDDSLIVIIICGLVVTCVYIVSEYQSWRSWHASEVRARLAVRDLYK